MSLILFFPWRTFNIHWIHWYLWYLTRVLQTTIAYTREGHVQVHFFLSPIWEQPCLKMFETLSSNWNRMNRTGFGSGRGIGLAQDCSELDVKKDHDHDLLLEAWHRSQRSAVFPVRWFQESDILPAISNQLMQSSTVLSNYSYVVVS